MKKTLKLFPQTVVLLLLACFFPLSVSANSPAPADHLTIVLSNLPDDVVYADLLIRIDENDPNYVDFQANAVADNIRDAEEIVNYASDGFRSFTFHYKNAKSNIKIEPYYDAFYRVDFCNGSEYQDFLTQYEDLCNHYCDIKIALLDKDFQIVTVSTTAELPKEKQTIVFSGDVYYDVSADCFDVDTWVNSAFFLFVSFFSTLLIVFSVGTEVVVSLWFGFKGKQVLTIFIVNACSQVIMRALYLVLPFPYLIETVALEVLVYGSEFLIYRNRFSGMSTRRLVGYTVIANTVSLLLGILLDRYLLLI